MSYFGARYYDPLVGRFIGMDPADVDPMNPNSFSRYAYANNNPYTYVDPDGELPILAVAFLAVDFYANYQASGSFGQAARDTALGALNPFKKIKTATSFTRGLKKLFRRGCCFVAGTEVITASGPRPIETIQVGDLVLAKNTETGEQDFKPVTHLFHENRRIFELIVETPAGGQTETIETSDDHPFYVVDHGFVRTDELTVGQRLETERHGPVVVRDVTQTERFDDAFHLEVADFHTFYASSLGILVHNSNCDPNATKSAGPLRNASGNLDDAARAARTQPHGPAPWSLGSGKKAEKWARQMERRGWTSGQITEALARGKSFQAPNKLNPANGATRYVHPETGRSVAIDNVTREVIHVGGDGFRY